MPDLEDRLPDLLRDLSAEATPLAMPKPDRALRRAMRRRLLNGASAIVLVAAIVSVSAAVVTQDPRGQRAGGSETVPPGTTPAFVGLWPETTASGLVAAQAQIDAGHEPWRTDAAQSAIAFATNVLGWTYDDVHARTVDQTQTAATISIANANLSHIITTGTSGDVDPGTLVRLARLGRTDDQGIWTVVDVEAPIIKLTTARTTDGSVEVAGSLRYTAEPESVRVQIIGGAEVLASTIAHLSPDFEARLPIPASASDRLMVVVQVLWNARDVLGATAFAEDSVGEASGATSPPFDAPAAVDRTRTMLAQAVSLKDIPALQTLMDPNTFSYNADDGSNPIVLWKEHPSVLDPIPSILKLAPTASKTIEGYGTFYVWPYLADSDFEHLTPSEIDDLHMLGFDDAAIEQMRQAGRYTGPRLSIDENGVWASYSTGGNH